MQTSYLIKAPVSYATDAETSLVGHLEPLSDNLLRPSRGPQAPENRPFLFINGLLHPGTVLTLVFGRKKQKG